MFEWTDKRVATLHRLAADGLSASEIGDEIGTTKCSVVSKCSRMGIALRGPPGVKIALTDADIAEAKSLRAKRWTWARIAARYGISQTTAKERIEGIQRHRNRKAEHDRRRATGERPIHGAGPDGCFISVHKPREVKRVINRDVIRQILAERNGSITIDTLRARLADV